MATKPQRPVYEHSPGQPLAEDQYEETEEICDEEKYARKSSLLKRALAEADKMDAEHGTSELVKKKQTDS